MENKVICEKSIAICCVYLMISAMIVWGAGFGMAEDEVCEEGEETRKAETVKFGGEDIPIMTDCGTGSWIQSFVGEEIHKVDFLKFEKIEDKGRKMIVITGESQGPYAVPSDFLLDGTYAEMGNFFDSPNMEFVGEEGDEIPTFLLENGKKITIPYDWENKIPEDIKSIDVNTEKGTVTYRKENGAAVVIGQGGAFLERGEGEKTVIKGFKEEDSEIDLSLGSNGEIKIQEDGKISYSGEGTTLKFEEDLEVQAKSKEKAGSINFYGTSVKEDFVVINSNVRNEKENYEISVDEKGVFFGDKKNIPEGYEEKFLTLKSSFFSILGGDLKLTGNLGKIVEEGGVVEFTNYGEDGISIDSSLISGVVEDGKTEEVGGVYSLGKDNKAIFKRGTAEGYEDKLVMEVGTKSDSSFVSVSDDSSTSSESESDPEPVNVPSNTGKKPTVPGVMTVTQTPGDGTTTQTPGTGAPPGIGDPGGGGPGGIGGLGGLLKWGLIIGGVILVAMLALGAGGDKGGGESGYDSYSGEGETTDDYEDTGSSGDDIKPFVPTRGNTTTFNNNTVTNNSVISNSSILSNQSGSCECDFSGCFNCPDDNCFNCGQNNISYR